MAQYPSYLNLSLKQLHNRAEKAKKILNKCVLCPRECRINRLKGERGFCDSGDMAEVSSFGPHLGEEPVLSGTRGSGTIFFTHCNLACVFCQNQDISQKGHGEIVSSRRLADIMLRIQDNDCHNLNLVSPTIHVPQILSALVIAVKKGFDLPIIYNTGTYDSVSTLRLLEGIVDIYMPDAKYSDALSSEKYSKAHDYPRVMMAAIKEMHRQVGDLVIKDGIAVKGLLVRHLVMPENIAGTEKIMRFIAKDVSKNTFINIIGQYHPSYLAERYHELSRLVTHEEMDEALKIAGECGLKRAEKY